MDRVNRHVCHEGKHTQGQLVVDLDKFHAHGVEGFASVLAFDSLGKFGLFLLFWKLDRVIQHASMDPAPLREQFPVQGLPWITRLRIVDALGLFIL